MTHPKRSMNRHERGVAFLEVAIIAPLAVATVFGLGFYADLYWTKTRLADSARVIARAIQDDPTISQGNWGG